MARVTLALELACVTLVGLLETASNSFAVTIVPDVVQHIPFEGTVLKSLSKVDRWT